MGFSYPVTTKVAIAFIKIAQIHLKLDANQLEPFNHIFLNFHFHHNDNGNWHVK